MYARDFTTSIHLMSEALRVHRLGKKEEAAAFARSAARLVAQRGEAECDLTSSNAVDAAVARAFGYLFEAKIALLRENGTKQPLHKGAEAWPSVQPYLLNALNALQAPPQPGDGKGMAWLRLPKEPESICTALGRIAGTLRFSGDNDSANVVSGWKYALCSLAAKSDSDDLYPEIIPDPTDASAPLWLRGVAVRKQEGALLPLSAPQPSGLRDPGVPAPLEPPPLTKPSPKQRRLLCFDLAAQ